MARQLKPGARSFDERLDDYAAKPEKMADIVDFMRAFQRTHAGRSPSVREIGEAVGFQSPSTTHIYLRLMERTGSVIRRRETGNGTHGTQPRVWSLPYSGCGVCEVLIPLARQIVDNARVIDRTTNRDAYDRLRNRQDQLVTQAFALLKEIHYG